MKCDKIAICTFHRNHCILYGKATISALPHGPAESSPCRARHEPYHESGRHACDSPEMTSSEMTILWETGNLRPWIIYV